MFEDDRSDQIDFFNWCIYVWINLIHTTWVFVMYSITALNIWRDEYRWIFTFSEYISIEKRRNWRNLFVNSWFNMPLSWLSSFCFHFFFNAFLFRRVSDTLLCESFCYLDDILMMIFLLKLFDSFQLDSSITLRLLFQQRNKFLVSIILSFFKIRVLLFFLFSFFFLTLLL